MMKRIGIFLVSFMLLTSFFVIYPIQNADSIVNKHKINDERRKYGSTIVSDNPLDTEFIYTGGWINARQYWLGNFTLRAEAYYGNSIIGITEDDTYLYAAGYTMETVYQYWKSNMTKKAETWLNMSNFEALESDDDYVYAATWQNNGPSYVIQYWKSNMTEKVRTADYGPNIRGLTLDDTYVYAGGNAGVIRQYWKSNMTQKATGNYNGYCQDLANDNDYIYAVGQTNTVIQYYKNNMTKKAETESCGYWLHEVEVDDTYVYTGSRSYTGPHPITIYWKSNMTKTSREIPDVSLSALELDTLFIYVGTFNITQYRKSDLTIRNQVLFANTYGPIEFSTFGAYAIDIYNVYPNNCSSDVEFQPVCSVDVVCPNGIINLTWKENSTSSWVTRQINVGISNGTYTWIFTQATNKSTIYYWQVFCDDGIVNYSRTFKFTTEENQPPNIPTIDGPNKGIHKIQYDYIFNSIDLEGDNVYIYVDWGDGTNSSWVGPTASGINVTLSHTWKKKGTYTITAKAKDIYDAESNWAALIVTISNK